WSRSARRSSHTSSTRGTCSLRSGSNGHVTANLPYRCVASFAGAVALLLSSVSPPAAAGARGTATHTVTIDGMQFQPAALTVKAGDSVVWVNNDPFPH